MSETLQRRKREAEEGLARALEQREELLRRLTLVETKVALWRRKLRHYERVMGKAKPVEPVQIDLEDAIDAYEATHAPIPAETSPKLDPVSTDPLDIPPHLRRTVAGASPPQGAATPAPASASACAADAAAAAAILAERDERSKAKARGRVTKLLAKKAGDTRRMPLSGSAALAFIRGEK